MCESSVKLKYAQRNRPVGTLSFALAKGGIESRRQVIVFVW